MYFLKFGIFRLLYPLNISLSSFLSEPNANPKYLVILVYSSFSMLMYKDRYDNLCNISLNNIQKDLEELYDKLFCILKLWQMCISFCKAAGLSAIKQISSACITRLTHRLSI